MINIRSRIGTPSYNAKSHAPVARVLPIRYIGSLRDSNSRECDLYVVLNEGRVFWWIASPSHGNWSCTLPGSPDWLLRDPLFETIRSFIGQEMSKEEFEATFEGYVNPYVKEEHAS